MREREGGRRKDVFQSWGVILKLEYNIWQKLFSLSSNERNIDIKIYLPN
jgi:hypothetical protein